MANRARGFLYDGCLIGCVLLYLHMKRVKEKASLCSVRIRRNPRPLSSSDCGTRVAE